MLRARDHRPAVAFSYALLFVPDDLPARVSCRGERESVDRLAGGLACAGGIGQLEPDTASHHSVLATLPDRDGIAEREPAIEPLLDVGEQFSTDVVAVDDAVSFEEFAPARRTPNETQGHLRAPGRATHHEQRLGAVESECKAVPVSWIAWLGLTWRTVAPIPARPRR